MKLEDHPDPAQRWFHRRWMAYLALFGGLLFPMLILMADSSLISDIAWPFYIFAGSIVAVYTGSAVWESVNINRSGS